MFTLKNTKGFTAEEIQLLNEKFGVPLHYAFNCDKVKITLIVENDFFESNKPEW